MKVRRLILCLALAMLADTAAGQDIVTVPVMIGNWNLMSGVVQANDLNTMNRIWYEQAQKGGQRKGERDRVAPTSTVQSPQLIFSPSATRRKQNLAHFVARSRSIDPQGASAMERLFAGTDVIAAMDKALAPVGLRTNNVADAYAVWWMSAWQAAHGDPTMPSRAKAQAVRAQAARALAATPAFGRADDAMKQEFAEALLVQTALIEGMMEEYGSDPAMAPKIAASVRQGARASGLDLDAMTLTEAGFVPAG